MPPMRYTLGVNSTHYALVPLALGLPSLGSGLPMHEEGGRRPRVLNTR